MPLPSPRSPGELDEKILALARAHAPAKNRAWPLGWGAGLATTAVLVVAVYITQLAPPEKESAVAPRQSVAKEEQRGAPVAAGQALGSAAVESTADYATEAELAQEIAADSSMPAAPLAASPAKAKATPGAPPTPSNVEAILDQLRELVMAGETEQAEEQYARLRESCVGCELPETLEQALATHD